MNKLHPSWLRRATWNPITRVFRGAILVAALGTLLVSAAPSYASDIYFSDGSSTLEKLSGFTVSPFASLPSGQAEGIVVNPSGDVFVASTTGNIYKYAGGNPLAVSTFATVGGVLSGLALDGSGNLYVANRSSGQIDQITSGGSVSPFTSGAPFLLPSGLAVSGSNLYVADENANTITAVALSNAGESLFANLSGGPFGLAADSQAVYASLDQTTDQILSMRISSPLPVTLVTFADSAVGGGLATDGLGNLFVGKIGGTNGSQILQEPTAGGAPAILALVNSDPNFLALAPAAEATPEPGTLVLGFAALASFLSCGALRRSARQRVERSLAHGAK
jgi:hypothetical protein